MIGCFFGFALDYKFVLAAVSLAAAVVMLIALKKYNPKPAAKISLIYAHLALLLFPLVLFSTNAACGMACMSCYQNPMEMLMLSLPMTLAASVAAGFVVIPLIFISSSRRVKDRKLIGFVMKHSKLLSIKAPRLYVVERARPIAFSFRSLVSGIFISSSMLQALSRKEKEAVLLHELQHIKSASSALKFSSMLLGVFSPLSLVSGFRHDSATAEAEADAFVVQIQNTEKHLLTAKKKFI